MRDFKDLLDMIFGKIDVNSIVQYKCTQYTIVGVVTYRNKTHAIVRLGMKHYREYPLSMLKKVA